MLPELHALMLYTAEGPIKFKANFRCQWSALVHFHMAPPVPADPDEQLLDDELLAQALGASLGDPCISATAGGCKGAFRRSGPKQSSKSRDGFRAQGADPAWPISKGNYVASLEAT